MEGLISYSLPIKGLQPGIHEYRFHIDGDFFRHFENSPIAEADIDLILVLDKRPGMLELEFDFSGTVRTECDRCLAPIDLPIGDTQVLLVKYSEEAEAEEAEIIYIHPEADALNVAKYAYEYIILAIPIIRIYDCAEENPPVCDQEMLTFLQEKEARDQQADEDNPAWKELKNWNKKQ